jgi:hypothetical protein
MLRMTQVRNLNNGDNSYKRKMAVRLIVLSLSAFFVSQVIPTLAEEQDLATELTAEIAPSESSPSPSPSPSARIETTTAPSGEPSAYASSSPSSTPTVYPARPSQSQGMVIQVPNEVSVDPRAQIVRIPRISVTGPEYLLVCINTVNTVVDILTIGAPDNVNATNLFISGDLTSTVTLSAPTTLVNTVFNASGGAKISALGRALAGQQVIVGFLAIDKQAEDASLCPKILSENRRVISIKALGLGIGMKKGEVTLKR